MKWLLVCLAVCFMVAPAMAGEDPYISIVGTDCVALTTNYYGQTCDSGFISFANPFYFSPKYRQFMYNEYKAPFSIPTAFQAFPPVTQYTRVGGLGTEQFRSQTLNNLPEVCSLTAGVGLTTAKTPYGNSGFYEWYIRVPKKPSSEINIAIQCGVLKPDALAFWGTQSIELCAAETGERVGAGTCVRQEVDPGVNPVNITGLPKITAIAYPGAFNTAFSPFHLTAFRNPSSYSITFNADTSMGNDGVTQLLDGSINTRVVLKACMDKTIITKLPVSGQVNAMGETETDLVEGDMIYVRMDVPRQNTVDIYCSAQSVRVQGIGESVY